MHHDARQMEGYDALESIGSGSFGLIRKVRRKTDGKILARKEIDYRKMSTKEKEQLVAEVNILKDLKHPNIVEFLERVIDREHSFIYILMEYCEGGDLASVIKRHKEKLVPIPEEFVWTIMTQLVLALHECHCGVIINEETNQPMPRLILHRDLKPDNVFLDAKKNVKLGDFGLSRSLTNPQKAFAQTYVGTPFYMSPELISDSVYDTKSDMWSLGCVVFEMCALEPPFLAETQTELSAKIMLGRTQTLPQQYSQELNMVVRAMLQVNPRRRPTTTDLLSNPRIRNTAMQLKKAAELADRDERLSEREMNVKTREEKTSEREAFLTNYERKCQAENQMLREKDNALNSREENIRNVETNLSEWQKKLSWEQQQLDKRRELLQEQERRQQSIAQKVSSSKQSESMTMDNGYSQEISTGKPDVFSAITTTLHPPFMAAVTSLTNAGGSLERYLAARGLHNASDQTQVTRIVPRRKTGLSAGRYSLQTSSAYRSMASGGTGTNGASYNPTTSSSVLDQGGSYTNGQLAGNSGSNQKQGTNGPSSAPTENPSIASKGFQPQSYTYQGSNGKEARLSGRLSQLPSLGTGGSTSSSSITDSQRLRGKSKSASTLIASMSSTSLSSTTPVPPSNPFLVPEPVKASTSATSTASIFSSTALRHNLTSNFNFTPPAAPPVKSSSGNSLVSTTVDVQMSETLESSSQQSAAPSGGVNYPRPTSSSNVLSGRNLTFHPPSNVPPSSSSSSSSAINGYSSRRLHASGTVGHIRFNPAPASTVSAVNNGLTATAAISTSSLATTSSGGPSLAATSAATTTSTSTAQSSSTTPSRSQSTTKFSGESYNRKGTPERSIRPEEEDLGMEWDDELPSPFIKRTNSRPPSSGIGGPSLSKNLLGA